ncbi:DUF2283 domain-containing protein [Bacillus bingmayongensis]|uniref:DUF2283 domain-containing protein n=1 Tax=Bacillus bingmayongensis TaxID=1150157 RepID=UPI001C8E695C|nr:DUF2283 domain-containing protein [Bacillus bingmayongensis]MBY0595814.1 DUF2283 domain-containing protein [Bacillus bingmayongensis]
MKSRITYDNEAKLAYLYIFSSVAQYKIQSTDELEVNEYLGLDIDQHDRIVGIEFFGPVASELSKLVGSEKIYKKNGNVYSFRLSEQEVKNKFQYKGIDFCFSDEGFECFIGFDVINLNKYDKDLLEEVTI